MTTDRGVVWGHLFGGVCQGVGGGGVVRGDGVTTGGGIWVLRGRLYEESLLGYFCVCKAKGFLGGFGNISNKLIG